MTYENDAEIHVEEIRELLDDDCDSDDEGPSFDLLVENISYPVFIKDM